MLAHGFCCFRCIFLRLSMLSAAHFQRHGRCHPHLRARRRVLERTTRRSAHLPPCLERTARRSARSPPCSRKTARRSAHLPPCPRRIDLPQRTLAAAFPKNRPPQRTLAAVLPKKPLPRRISSSAKNIREKHPREHFPPRGISAHFSSVCGDFPPPATFTSTAFFIRRRFSVLYSIAQEAQKVYIFFKLRKIPRRNSGKTGKTLL